MPINMKTIIRNVSVKDNYLTDNDCPITENACAWLDRWQRILLGRGFKIDSSRRGYGGPISGHWLKLTKQEMAIYRSLNPNA